MRYILPLIKLVELKLNPARQDDLPAFLAGVIHKCLALLSVDPRESKLVYCNFIVYIYFWVIDKVVAVGLYCCNTKVV